MAATPIGPEHPLPPVHWTLWLGLLMVIGAGALLDVMEVDAAQYATMARDMLGQEDKLKLYFRGRDYLDKPPLLFWTSALSFGLFGIHNWSYKLPSILFAAAGVVATYRYARLFQPKPVATWAAFMFASSTAFVIMTNDVRTDTMLTACIMLAIWTGSEFLRDRRWLWALTCGLAMGGGLLAKGPLGAVAPFLVLSAQVVVHRKWSIVRDPRLWSIPLVAALVLVPMLVGLYEQHGPHGIRFFFWEQSFGRITGENRWKDDSTVLFFTHEVPWLLLPWTLFCLVGLWRAVRMKGTMEQATAWSACILFVALSLSQFKLPHYIYPVLPMLAVLGAGELVRPLGKLLRASQAAIVGMLYILAWFLVAYSFPTGAWPAWLGLLLALLGSLLVIRKRSGHALITVTAVSWLAAAWTLNTQVYPAILVYQSNAQVGRWLRTEQVPPDRFVTLHVGGTALEFYGSPKGTYYPDIASMTGAPQTGTYLYTDQDGRDALLQRGWVGTVVHTCAHYPVQLPGSDLLLPDRREQALQQRFILRY
jgi:4-amino-4-deoxy-L-arabinose transferase-like glycosyltransferase